MNSFTTKMLVSGLAVGLFASSAQAAESNGSFEVGASVSGSCVLVAENVNFGSYDAVVGGEKTVMGNVGVRCTEGVAATIYLDQGLFADVGTTCTDPKRRMADGNKFISYELYIEEKLPWFIQQWGCNDQSGAYVRSQSSLEFFNIPVGGVISEGQNIQIGRYADTVGVTVTF